MRLNRRDYLTAINRRAPLRQRQAAWRNLASRRAKAVRLVEEMNLRTNKLQPIFEQLRRSSDRMVELHRLLADDQAASRPGMPTRAEMRSELVELMRLTQESPTTLAPPRRSMRFLPRRL